MTGAPLADGRAPAGAFAAIGRFSARHRRWVVGIWILSAVVMGLFARGLQGRLGQGGYEVPGSDSLAVQHLLVERFPGQSPATAIVVVSNPRVTVDDPSYRRAVVGVRDRVRAVPGVGAVGSMLAADGGGFVSADRHTTYLVAGLNGNQNQQLVTAGRVLAVASEGAPAGYTVDTGGASAFYERLNTISKQDLARAEVASFPITLVVLLLAFGTLVAAGLPILLAVASLVVTLGGLYFLAGVTNMNVYVTNTASIIGIGVGIDYALFIITRFREERSSRPSIEEAVAAAVATSGRAVALSGATVVIALAGMFLVDIEAFRSMAIGAMTVVAVAVLAALTLLPAVLAALGPRVDRLAIRLRRRRSASPGRFWHRWSLAIMARPWTFLAVSLAFLLLLAAPLLSIRLGQSGPSTLPANESPRLASERLASAFGAGVTGPVEILVRTPTGAGSTTGLARVAALGRLLAAHPAVRSVQSLATLAPGGDLAALSRLLANGPAGAGPALGPAAGQLADWSHGATLSLVTVVTNVAPESKGAESFVGRVRDADVPRAGLAGQVLVGGATAFNVDLEHAIDHRFPMVIAAVLALSYLLLLMAFRSVLLPLKAILMNLLSVGASYGLLVALFQWGWLAEQLRFTSTGAISVFIPMFLFSILFGLSMDYEVFLMTRIREEYLRTGSNELAVAGGLERSGRVITSAALIMFTVFAAFASSRLIDFKELGFGLAMAVLIDATVVRTVLVPATMKLLGGWNWWMPAWLDRLLPRIALETERPDPAATGPAAVRSER